MNAVKEMKQKIKLNTNEIIPYIEELKKGLDPIISPVAFLAEVEQKIQNNKNTDKITDLLVDIAMSKSTLNPDYSILASRIFVSTLHQNTKNSFSEKMEDLFNNGESKSSFSTPLITAEELQIIKQHKKRIENTIDYKRDYNYSVFALKELEDNVLTKSKNQTVERPQDFLMRVAIGIHKDKIEEVIKTYNYMSEGWYLHFPSHLSLSGMKQTHAISSYSIALGDENISSLFDQLKACVEMSQSNKEIGIAVHDVPSKVFTSTLNLFNETANYLNQEQETSARPFTMYLEPWHADVFDFLTLNNDHNESNFHSSNLNCALWVPDLFMERVKKNEIWTLMCPSECPGLSDTYGKEFEVLYKKYEVEGKGQQTIKAQELWFKILESQIEIGSTRLLFKDQINKKVKQSTFTIKAPGYSKIKFHNNSDEDKCNTHVALSLPRFVSKKGFDFEKLYKVVNRITNESNTLNEQNKTLDNQESGALNIPVYIEIQGLAETFLKLKLPFHSEEATRINKEILDTIQSAATNSSIDLAEEKESKFYNPYTITFLSNSEITKILGHNEGCAPLTSYINTHKWSTGSTLVVNEHLLKDLKEEGLWTQSLFQKIIQHQGSIQNILEIPEHIKEVYKTTWEISQKNIVDRISDCESTGIQPQPMEIFITNPNFSKLTSIYFYGWRKGLDTGISHLRTKIDPETMEFSINRDVTFNTIEVYGI